MAWLLQDISTRSASEAVSLATETELLAHLNQLAAQAPRVISLSPVGAGYLQVGIGGPWAFFEFNQDDPWRVEAAVPDSTSFPESAPETVAFACGGDQSEIPGTYMMPVQRAVGLIAEMLRTGELTTAVRWEAQE